MRRTVNPALVAATVVALLLAGQYLSIVSDGAGFLRFAKQDAYTSLAALSSARAIGYDANADQSLYLLSRGEQVYEDSFQKKMALLTSEPIAPLMAELQAPTARARFTGVLAVALNNARTQSERQPVLQALSSLAAYQEADARVRGLQRAGQRDEAAALSAGRGAQQAAGIFDQFDAAIGRAIAINQQAFDRNIEQMLGRLGTGLLGADALATAAILLIALLAWLGLQPRIDEYR
jgi:hypothetical protein